MDIGVMCKLRGGKIVKQLDEQIERQGKQIDGAIDRMQLDRQIDRKIACIFLKGVNIQMRRRRAGEDRGGGGGGGGGGGSNE